MNEIFTHLGTEVIKNYPRYPIRHPTAALNVTLRYKTLHIGIEDSHRYGNWKKDEWSLQPSHHGGTMQPNLCWSGLTLSCHKL